MRLNNYFTTIKKKPPTSTCRNSQQLMSKCQRSNLSSLIFKKFTETQEVFDHKKDQSQSRISCKYHTYQKTPAWNDQVTFVHGNCKQNSVTVVYLACSFPVVLNKHSLQPAAAAAAYWFTASWPTQQHTDTCPVCVCTKPVIIKHTVAFTQFVLLLLLLFLLLPQHDCLYITIVYSCYSDLSVWRVQSLLNFSSL